MTTEFNAQEIIDFLKFRFIHRSVCIEEDSKTIEGSEKSDFLHNSNKDNLNKLIEDVRKVERLKTEIEAAGYNRPSCSWCNKKPNVIYENCKLSAECFLTNGAGPSLKHFEWRYTIEDFK